LNIKVKERKPVKDYIRLQGRFRHLTEDEVQRIQDDVDARWARLTKMCGA